MFSDLGNLPFRYAPVLSLKPAEMSALRELPNKDKDLILPIIPLRGWLGSKRLKNSTELILKVVGDRPWLADIDASFLAKDTNKDTGEESREVFSEIRALLDSTNGYDNWCQYVEEIPNAIPCLQTEFLEEFESQFRKLESLGRGVGLSIDIEDPDDIDHATEIIDVVEEFAPTNFFLIFDLGKLRRTMLETEKLQGISTLLAQANTKIPEALIAVSGSSFPDSFGGQDYGENPILERQLFQGLQRLNPDVPMVYSDRGSARASEQGGGGNTPPPRIDYPLRNDWRFIRKEFQDSSGAQEGEKEKLYTAIASELMEANYWNPDINVWGTQVIQYTSLGENNGINTPARATAVRINIHLYQQLHYESDIGALDTDEDWVD